MIICVTSVGMQVTGLSALNATHFPRRRTGQVIGTSWPSRNVSGEPRTDLGCPRTASAAAAVRAVDRAGRGCL